jgi:hypothetical protein
MSDRAIFKEMKDFIYLTAVIAGYLLSSSEGYSVEGEVRKREIGLLMARKSDDNFYLDKIRHTVLCTWLIYRDVRITYIPFYLLRLDFMKLPQ